MLLLPVGAIVVVVGLVVFWIEPLSVLGVLERLKPRFLATRAARLKSCPDTHRAGQSGVEPPHSKARTAT